MSRQAQWVHTIVSDLQVVLGALPFATPPEALALVRAFVDRVPVTARRGQTNNLECLFRGVLHRLDTQLPRQPDAPLPLRLFDADVEGTVCDRLRRTIEQLAVRAEKTNAPPSVYGHFAEDDDTPTAAGTEHWRIAAFHMYLQRQYSHQALDLVRAAAAQGVTPEHLSRLLKAKTGQGFTWHRDSYRLRAARRLLRATTKSTKEIASEVGYVSDEQFCRRFRRRYQITPSGYRAQAVFAQYCASVGSRWEPMRTCVCSTDSQESPPVST